MKSALELTHCSVSAQKRQHLVPGVCAEPSAGEALAGSRAKQALAATSLPQRAGGAGTAAHL